jgi:hypothetical protein
MAEMKLGRNVTIVTPDTEAEVIHIATMKQITCFAI